MNPMSITILPLLWFWIGLLGFSSNTQEINLLQNPRADDGTNYWRMYGDATVEQTGGGNWHFVVRNKGYFVQDVNLPDGSVGKYALLIGRASSERINPDGAITGLPYLYGYMMERGTSRGGRIKSYLQGQQMLCAAKNPNEWITVAGIFEVPAGTGKISFFLNQAERRDMPQNGSAARFDDLGLYLFPTAEEAKSFVQSYENGRTSRHR
jgi:hypothetical protein